MFVSSLPPAGRAVGSVGSDVEWTRSSKGKGGDDFPPSYKSARNTVGDGLCPSEQENRFGHITVVKRALPPSSHPKGKLISYSLDDGGGVPSFTKPVARR
ncbi:hypothetical protein C0Q70_19634 [Pomacea canaliculata]|uniref:Uncharacterized protein n=1 Tax=Pomacea canaliculata TaxID=400727 RepID=A0A2T7NJX3_POMCA|nr:hypothetical protein C0Q70_19634 [Pomacea canaliculata]